MGFNPVAGIDQLSGIALVGLVCGLMFVEELGVPLPFAPGDLVLLLAGMAVAAGRVSPWVMIPALLVTILIGAMLGREIFGLVGRKALNRLADRWHFRHALDRCSKMLQAGGWRAVIVGRLFPGLRVHTNEVAGAIGVTRRTYLLGLVPATLVYVGLFAGLGALVGRPVLDVIHQNESRLLLLVGAAILIAVVLFLIHRRPQLSFVHGRTAGPGRGQLPGPRSRHAADPVPGGPGAGRGLRGLALTP